MDEDLSQAQNNNVGFMATMNNNDDDDHMPRSPSTSSCITDLSNEECGEGEEASSKLIASAP